MKNLLIGLTAATALTLTGGIASAGEVNLYTSNSEDSVAMVLDKVREEAPDITLNVIAGSSGTLLRRIEAEKDNNVADLFWSSGFSTLAEFSELFEKYDSPEVDNLLPALQAKDDSWTGTNTHVMVLMVNEDIVGGEVPETWEDIMEESWKGKVTMADPANSSSAYAQLYGIYKLYGEKGVQKLAKVVELQGSTSGAYSTVAQGEFAVGMTMEYAAQRYVAGGQKEIKLVYPSDGTFLSPEGLALIKNAPHPDDAKRVYDLLLSQDMQAGLVGLTFRRPSRADLDEALQSSGLPLMKDIKIIDIDQSQAAADREMLLELWAKSRG
ncbi:extracellular solute-binding protein [Notoacmeibacter sp. MSK16QG-6]|uniref:extracellular solute-binding protein n=1 Tax=Notoacmeibacter sp. MSK16QG-6 TaxID=2957982 RepID=UPI0020A1ADCC|nr:extracellular solute-binding protein [Notoacmeibacter sp. MSK16QG-6]MCP1200021.1 extracellular solute-binding protein [Notoacmeibacter sp. MSK16QG-6]